MIELINGDNSRQEYNGVDVVLTDPPYGIGNNCNYSRFSGGLSPSRNHHRGVIGDDQPFDPTPWLAYPKVVLFGFQHFAEKLPPGTVFVWLKKRDNQLGTFQSDCELAWYNKGKGCYLHRHIWNGFDRQSEKGKTLHPCQKPVAIFAWIIERLKLKPNSHILDPFMGAGACGVATVQAGHRFTGIEIDEEYFRIAKERIESANKEKR